MADLGDLLNSNDPESLQRLLALRSQLSPQQMTEEDIADATKNAPAPSSMALPWGGLTGQPLQDYIKQNPGPEATIGFNPNVQKDIKQDDDSEDDEDDTAPSSLANSGATRSPAQAPDATSPTAQGPTQKDVLSSLMDKLYGPGASDRLKMAQSSERQVALGNALNMAGKEIAAGLSRGAYKPDYTSNQQISKDASLPVQQELQQRAAAKEAIDSGIKLSDFQDKQQLSDSGSSLSAAYRNMASVLVPQLAKTPGFENMSAESIKQAQPMVDTYMKAQMMQLARQQMNQTKADQRQQQTFNQTIKDLEQMRGSPAVSQAEKDLYSAQKAKSLSNLYGDPNNLSPQMASLFTQEIGKIATGGIPTHEELAALSPKTLQGELASVWSRLSNDPTPANAGAFIKQYQDYTNALGNDAQKVIQDRYGRIINSRKSQFTDDQNQYLKDNYLNRFKDATTTYSPSQEAGIDAFMKGNNITDRNQAIDILKKGGKL